MRARLQLDFVAPRKRSRLAGIVVLAAALGLAAHLVLKYRDTQDRLAQLAAVEAMVSAPRPARAAARAARRRDEGRAGHGAPARAALVAAHRFARALGDARGLGAARAARRPAAA